ncbi:DNA polymerase I [Cryobacterium psychrotolerans]|uniref:DNA polymerase I n=1 Tax=Cryobacterium psychrotolerans TaxID=386301 RepID=A0A1G8ZSP6_9MICO|nr:MULTISPECIES: DNA polymerase I [Cryobacterium]TFD47426.1 DNA polymerase I [Cryobacterium sp. TMT1-2-1]TFD87464.1 DNA polymerase I [Cryobacterium psychrotolerans]SDK17634.1 DNA polymerase I [Cryobacterium psychrotolerans]
MLDSEKPTLMIIDGHSLAFRAFHALPLDSFQTHDGQHTNAIHGFLSMLLSLLRTEKPTHIAVAFDISRASFRTREYPEYKGTRGATPSEFIGQVPLLEQALAAMNITTLTKADYEADDILATLSVRGTTEGYHVLVVSGDRDTIQLVNENVTLLYPASQGVSALTRYDPDRVRERYGVDPGQYPDVAALVGETSDNLIGISKVGEKTAVKWLGLYGSLDGILEHADEIKGVVGNNLREQKDNAIRNRRLNHLVTDLDLPVEITDLGRAPINQEAVREVFGRLEFKSLLERVIKLEGGDTAAAATVAAPAEPRADLPVAPRAHDLLDEELEAWITRATAACPDGLGLTVEVQGGVAIGFGLASRTDALNLPWQPDRADYAPFEAWLASDAPKIMHDAKHQAKAISRSNLVLGGLAVDTLVAGWLLRPGGPDKTLADLVSRYLDEVLPVHDPNQLVPDESADGGVPQQAWYTLRLSTAVLDRLDPGSRHVLTAIEMPTLRALAEMELAGISVSHDQLAVLSAELGDTAAHLAAGAYAEIGREVNLGSPKQLQEVLFDQLGMPRTRANKTGFTTDAGALADLQASNPHPFLDLLLKHRDATKLRQIVETLDKAIDETGRIHTNYVQIGTATGRISSNDPNLQNIPIRTEEGRRIRAAFQAGEGAECLLTADYSQIEMRIMAHLSGDAGLIEAFNAGEDLHRFVGSRIFGVAPDEVTPQMRSRVKAMSYGLAYGLSAFGLSKQLRIQSSEAKQLMTDYFSRFGAVRDYLRHVVEQAKIDGYTETIFGRRRPFPELHSPNRVLRENAERAALNAPIQGSAADIMKLAMIGIAEDLSEAAMESRMLLQVHDELVFDVAPGEFEALRSVVTLRMSTAADLLVPLDVQIGRGRNWDEAAH